MVNEWDPVICYCWHCGEKLIGYKNNKNIVKIRCPKCGATTVSKKINRRHERLDIYIH